MNAPDTAVRPSITSSSLAAAEAAFPKPSRFESLPLGAIAPSMTATQQLRRSLFVDAELDELATSIKRIGLAQPIVVREHPQPDGFIQFELVAGEKRWLASQRAGLHLIQSVVRDLNDDELLELQLAENIQRDTLHPLVEATGYQEMIDRRGLTLDQVREQVGKSKAWVYNRLKLLELGDAPRRALLAGDIAPSLALRIARIPSQDLQNKALARIVRGADPTKVGEPMSDREAAQYIHENFTRELRGVAFKLDDETLLPAAGTCIGCPKRSGNMGDLFTEIKNPNVCTDTKCLDAKLDAHTVRERAALEANGHTVITGVAAKKIKPEVDGKLKGYVRPDEMVMVGDQLKSYKEALGEDLPAAEILEDPFTRQLVPVIKADVVKQAMTKAGIQGAHRSYDGAANKKAADKARVESAVRFRLLAEIRAKPPAGDDMQVIAQHMWATLSFDAQKRLVESRHPNERPAHMEPMDFVVRFQKKIAAMKPGDLAVLLRDMALVAQCHVSDRVRPDAKELFATAKRLGIKEDKVREAVEKELAEPVATKKKR